MIFYSDKNVYEASKERIRFLFDEFKDRKIVVSFSGGKDSTTILHLVKEVMDERGIKKIPVFFCDQELEAPQTIEYVRKVMNYNWVEPYWIQSYFQEWNASKGEWFNVWGYGEKWARSKEPSGTYTDEKYKVTRHFKEVLNSMLTHHFGDDYVALGGVRAQESPMRRNGLTLKATYKDITWAKSTNNGKAFVFYPIWDWLLNDVWYYIFSNRIEYCKLYNYMFTKKSLPQCRVSSFLHENAIQSLSLIKEIAIEFYESAVRRVSNVNTTVQTYNMLCEYVGELPQYFSSWTEYAMYLADNLINNEKYAEKIKRRFLSELDKFKRKFGLYKQGIEIAERKLGELCVKSIISEDFELSKMSQESYRLIEYFNNNYGEIKKANIGNDKWCE